MTEGPEIKFGANTAGLEAGANRAVSAVHKISQAANGLAGALKLVTSAYSNNVFERFAKDGEEKVVRVLQKMGVEASVAEELFAKLAVGMAAIGAAVVAYETIQKAVEWGEKFAEAGEKAEQTAEKLGISATEMSKWGNVMTLNGRSSEQFSGAVTKLERSMTMAANGGKRQAQAFAQMGVSIDDLKSKSPDKLLLQIADAAQKMKPEESAKKIGVFMSLMGRSGAEMAAIFNLGSKVIKEQMATAEEYGSNVSESFQKAAVAMAEALNEQKVAGKGWRDLLFESLAPALTEVVKQMNYMAKAFIASYRDGGVAWYTIKGIAVAFTALVGTIGTVVFWFRELIVAFKMVALAIASLISYFVTLGQEIWYSLTGQSEKGAALFEARMKKMASVTVGLFGEMKDAAADYKTFMDGLSNPQEADHKAKEGAESQDLVDEAKAREAAAKEAAKAAKEAAKEAKRLAKEQLAEALADLDYRKDLAKDDYKAQVAIEQEKLAKIAAMYGTHSKEYEKELRVRNRMTVEHNKEIAALEKEAISAQLKMSTDNINTSFELNKIKISARRAELDAELADGKISAATRVREEVKLVAALSAIEQDHEDGIYGIKLLALKGDLALYSIETKEYAKTCEEIEALEAEHQNKMKVTKAKADADLTTANRKVLNEQVQHWKDMLAPITTGMNQTFNNLLNGQVSWKNASLQLVSQVAASYATMAAQAAIKWAAHEAAKTAATATGTSIRSLAEAKSAVISVAHSAWATIMQIGHAAARAAAGAYAAIVSIPYVGPVLAPIAAATALAAVFMIGKSIASASGGMDIGAGMNPLTQLHEQEMVLPAHLANPLRAMLRSASPGPTGTTGAGVYGASASTTSGDTQSGGAGMTVNVHLNTIDQKTGGEWLMSNHRVIAGAVHKAVRAGYSHA